MVRQVLEKRKLDKKWIVLAAGILIIIASILLLVLPEAGPNIKMIDVLIIGMAFIVWYIYLNAHAPRLEVLKGIAGVFFIGGLSPPFYKWPLFIISIALSAIYLKNLRETNDRRNPAILVIAGSVVITVITLYFVGSLSGFFTDYWRIVLFG